MTVNPQLDVLREKIEAAGDLVTYLTEGTRLDAVSPTDWTEILADLWRLQSTIASATGTAVTEARRAGRTWEDVGDCLRLTKQGAQQKYGAR